jgi:hypothetical protein
MALSAFAVREAHRSPTGTSSRVLDLQRITRASLAEFQELELPMLGVIASSDVAGVRTMMFT